MPSQWTFTQGLLVGQASFLFLCLLFIRYVVFSPSDKDDESWKERRKERAKLSTTAVPPPPSSHLLNKTGYEMATHPAESTDWINVLFAQILQGYRNDLLGYGGEEGARQKVEEWLNPEGKSMSWIDPIQVTSLSLGNSFPLLSNARIRPADGQGHIRAEVDIDYVDTVSLAISTSVLINFPRPRFAVLPVSIRVELASVGGTLSIQMHDPKNEQQHVHLCLLPDFHFNLKTSSLLGSRAKLQDIPKLEQLIVARLRAVIQDRLVYPHHITFSLPRILSTSGSASASRAGSGAASPALVVHNIAESAVDAAKRAVSSGLIGKPSADSRTGVDSAGLIIGWGQDGRSTDVDIDIHSTRAGGSKAAPGNGVMQVGKGSPGGVGAMTPRSPASNVGKRTIPIPAELIQHNLTGDGGFSSGFTHSQLAARQRQSFLAATNSTTVPPPGPGSSAYRGQADSVGGVGNGTTTMVPSVITATGVNQRQRQYQSQSPSQAPTSNQQQQQSEHEQYYQQQQQQRQQEFSQNRLFEDDSSLAPSQSQSQFRFRGPFASPSERKMEEAGAGGASQQQPQRYVNAYESRRVGALNSRVS